MRLHDYDRVYAVPGLYEEVVQHQLACASPAKIAEVLMRVAGRGARPARLLRVLDLGAGNGIVGEELRAHGVEVLAGTDSAANARDAANRDRPGLYTSYVVGDTSGVPELGTLVRELGINCIVCAGALGFEHIEAHSFAELWELLPAGAMFALTVHEDLADPGTSDIGDELRAAAQAGLGHGDPRLGALPPPHDDERQADPLPRDRRAQARGRLSRSDQSAADGGRLADLGGRDDLQREGQAAAALHRLAQRARPARATASGARSSSRPRRPSPWRRAG